MLRQKCYCKNDLETRKKVKCKEEIRLTFAVQQKQVKGKLPAENADIWWLQ